MNIKCSEKLALLRGAISYSQHFEQQNHDTKQNLFENSKAVYPFNFSICLNNSRKP